MIFSQNATAIKTQWSIADMMYLQFELDSNVDTSSGNNISLLVSDDGCC